MLTLLTVALWQRMQLSLMMVFMPGDAWMFDGTVRVRVVYTS
jgi:hypothetical protein